MYGSRPTKSSARPCGSGTRIARISGAVHPGIRTARRVQAGRYLVLRAATALVDTSYWETRTRTEYQQQTQTVERTIPGRWKPVTGGGRSAPKPINTRSNRDAGRPRRCGWKSRTRTQDRSRNPKAAARRGSTRYPAITPATRSGPIRTGLFTTGPRRPATPIPGGAVSLGSVSKGAASSYDALAFNGRGSGADGLLLAGLFYRNYLPNGDCFDPVSVVFFQDDSVVSGDLDQQVEPEPAPGQEPDPTDEPTIEPTPNPDPTPAPSPSPNPTARPDPTIPPRRTRPTIRYRRLIRRVSLRLRSSSRVRERFWEPGRAAFRSCAGPRSRSTCCHACGPLPAIPRPASPSFRGDT